MKISNALLYQVTLRTTQNAITIKDEKGVLIDMFDMAYDYEGDFINFARCVDGTLIRIENDAGIEKNDYIKLYRFSPGNQGDFTFKFMHLMVEDCRDTTIINNIYLTEQMDEIFECIQNFSYSSLSYRKIAEIERITNTTIL
ncbi:hypothetical protein [Acinetobacter sp. ANC 4648]|uniref:hypothetical protein n=1 Tax=Acinetobacter sp. ANC 4648 TaxID=1977875 RepID=UPI000A3591A9|nr:hypothetical protein [Acinetobacter sp. ANC 4648]OTG82171.1 hypothetical protein B9T27_07920 [Acinetobacter sp. ANC 4648]